MITAVGETTYVTPTTGAEGIADGLEMLRAENVHIRYRLYEDVSKTLGGTIASLGRRRRYREVHALKDVSFSAYAGEAIGVIGANGSGKTTLMQAISGLLPVNEGAVYARATPMLLGVGAILNKQLSGRRNIMLGGLALGLTREEILEREEEIIDFAGIGDAIDWPMKAYSSGMAARLQFAVSAAVRPEILIIDEALAVGDRDFKKKSQRRIEKLREKAGTVFLVTHSMQQIRNMCTRAFWLDEGRLMVDGDPEDVVDAYNETDTRREEKLEKTKRKAKRVLKRLHDLDEAEAAAISEDVVGPGPDSQSA